VDIKKLDTAFEKWLASLAASWTTSVERAAAELAYDEIENRFDCYPAVGETLSEEPLDIRRFADAARECWVIGERFQAIRFSHFVAHPGAARAVTSLVKDFPSLEVEACARVDRFVEHAAGMGYVTDTGSRDAAGAAALASLVLTSLWPHRFVDYRRGRWTALAQSLGHLPPAEDEGYGRAMVWAGQFARCVTRTTTYERLWPRQTFGYPLWVMAAICWSFRSGKFPERPSQEVLDARDASFPEGAVRLREHLLRERSPAVVQKAKELGRLRDPELHCHVCGFSFLEAYGERGEGFIQAHHTIPLSELSPGTQTRAKDLALVCANCHCMLHRGEQSLSVDELKAVLAKRRSN
jgi:hypothetical protein